jgi:acetyl-CoA acyltransferase
MPGTTINRLWARAWTSSAQRAPSSQGASMMIAGGVESMSRAPFVMGRAEDLQPRCAVYDTLLWLASSTSMKENAASTPCETAENGWRRTTKHQP